MSRGAVLALIAAALVGCGDKDDPAPAPPDFGHPPPLAQAPPGKPLKPPRCPVQAENCATATGTLLTLEARDPDGDGDAHLILLSPQGITGPGITVIDVERELRPHPLPQPGDAVAAAGPVYSGSYGQQQIQATELRIGRE